MKRIFVLAAALVACGPDLHAADFDKTTTGQVRIYFNEPGTHGRNEVDTRVEDRLVSLIESARQTLDIAAMGFSNQRVVRAAIRAHLRGVRVRFVGDARHLEHGDRGYEAFEAFDIPLLAGNQQAIMHDKFFVVDGRLVFTGTGNITPTDFHQNDNNWMIIDSPQVARDFTEEIEQMLDGRFGYAKRETNDRHTYQVGDTKVEVYFSPQEDAMGRILSAVASAKRSIHFHIFAFTKDEVGSAFIERLEAFKVLASEQGFSKGDTRGPGVFGVIDRSQLHSNASFHEAYRLSLFGADMVLDGNDNSVLAGDYQGGGGRQHSKTMIIDAGTPDAKVLTGSFNWSSSATLANDENLIVLHGQRVADDYMRQWQRLWENGHRYGDYYGTGDQEVKPGDVIINEVHWDGYNGEVDGSDAAGDDVGNDEFIELLNTTDRILDLSLFVLGTRDDFTLGLYPGTVIGPYERFLIVDHNVEPFDDLAPQLEGSAFLNPQFVMNTANDPRFLRLNLHNAAFYLRLVSPSGELIDEAGDGGPPFAGGRRAQADGSIRNASMERVFRGDAPAEGTRRDGWAASSDCAGVNVRPVFHGRICATPGQRNSQQPFSREPDPNFRAPERESEP
jgi:phosphatidylserine/phosphatidylglycerophosphate/cardiolipin synthase-like enzyme